MRIENYDWSRDFPKSLQESSPNGRTILDFEFELSEVELSEFREEIKSTLNGMLPIRLLIGKGGDVEVKVRKQGVGGSTLTKKARQISSFVGNRLRLEYVPAVRTADDASRVVESMLEEELAVVEQGGEYADALEKIKELQQPVLERISRQIHDVLGEFLPDVSRVDVSIAEEKRRVALRSVAQIIVDDGVSTDLYLKGDGAQSLAAMALLRSASVRAAEDRLDLVLAIEEPEAHLHPEAIHRLKRLLEEVGETQQVIIATHSPLLANRKNMSSNIIVKDNKASPCRNIGEVREILGVRLADNLQSARFALVLEGEDDVIALRKILSQYSDVLAAVLDSGELALDSLGGASNLTYKITQLRAGLCLFHAFLDDDAAGRAAAESSISKGVLLEAQRSFCITPGQGDSEFEDCIHPEVYRDAVLTKWNVDVRLPPFRGGGRKWSERLREAFRTAGQPWGPQVESRVKMTVAHTIEGYEGDPIVAAKRGPIDSLVRILENEFMAE